MTSLPPELQQLADAYGIATRYTDWQGEPVEVAEQTVVAVLAAMEVDASTPEAVHEALEAQRLARWRRMLPACMVVQAGQTALFWVHVSDGDPVEVSIELETGGVHDQLRQLGVWVEPREVDGRRVGEATFEIPPDLPLGYHTLRARSGDDEATMPLVVTPPFVGIPESLGDRRAWGFAAQIYSVRSHESWGVGDFVDMTDLAVWSGAELGADYLLVNPLHAAEPVAPMEPSPYLPTSRRFWNPLYLRVDRIPEYAALDKSARTKVDRIEKAAHKKLDDLDRIDRNTSWTAKRQALELVFAVRRTVGRDADFAAFCAREGQALDDFAAWSVLAGRHGNDFRQWPEQLQDPQSAAVMALRTEAAQELEFQKWLQWVADEQLQTAQTKATATAGMALGLMHDLAVGVHSGGADVWRLQHTYARDIQVGAPPDAFNQMGQDWGQPPWRPDRLEEEAYRPFRELMATVLRHAGGVRIDHIIGLFRLWWIPRGATPGKGTYVRYDHEALIGILALEAHRAGAVVVGEDLGTVEPSARDYLRSRGILGTSILWFERNSEGQPLPAEQWRELCMASVTTHDLPPTAGYLAADHVRLRDELGLLTRPLDEEVKSDEADREGWMSELRDRGLLPASPSIPDTVEALHEYLTRTPSRLLNVALVDAVGDRRTQNQPGTIDEYPNWRVPLSDESGDVLWLEEVMASSRPAAVTASWRQSDAP